MQQSNLTIKINPEGRKIIRTQVGVWENYSRFVARNNPDICGEWFDGCEVHHKDFDKTNDIPENLIVVTPEEHREIHKNMGNNRKMVRGYFKNVCVGVFESMVKASIKTGVSVPSISYYCKHKTPISKTYDDWKWEYV